MWIIYLAGIKIYGLIISILSPFNDKAKKWVRGRRGLLAHIAREVEPRKRSIWFHFASLGEFEQGRPVLEAVRSHWPETPVVVTFYSPSGYEIRKNTPLADHVFYLPQDTPANAKAFIRLINPTLTVFTKYEYWPFYFRELAAQRVPLYLISAIFRPNQLFFKPYGGFFKKTLQQVTHFFTQNEASLLLLARLGIRQATLAGDTRFDRVVTLPESHKQIPAIEAFADHSPVLIAGSTWPADEELLSRLHDRFPSWKIVIAPHEIHEDHLRSIEALFSDAIRFSRIQEAGVNVPNHTSHVLLIDNIGMLSSLYAYGQIAYIGGGFGVGIHNTLEAAAYGIPVIFGPNYHKFQEANDLLTNGGGFCVHNADELVTVFENLNMGVEREKAGQQAGHYVREKAGATEIILRHLIDKEFGRDTIGQ